MDWKDLVQQTIKVLQEQDSRAHERKVVVRGTRRAQHFPAHPSRSPTTLHRRPNRNRPQRRIKVNRSEPPYWRQQGWQRSRLGFSPGYTGYYRTPHGSFRGEIKESYSGNHEFFIIKPPRQMKKHPHWVCFTHQGNGRYLIHFSKRPRDIDSGIVAIERMIRESLDGRRR